MTGTHPRKQSPRLWLSWALRARWSHSPDSGGTSAPQFGHAKGQEPLLFLHQLRLEQAVGLGMGVCSNELGFFLV